jgi:tRNA-dihydrouridine synthase 1
MSKSFRGGGGGQSKPGSSGGASRQGFTHRPPSTGDLALSRKAQKAIKKQKARAADSDDEGFEVAPVRANPAVFREKWSLDDGSDDDDIPAGPVPVAVAAPAAKKPRAPEPQQKQQQPQKQQAQLQQQQKQQPQQQQKQQQPAGNGKNKRPAPTPAPEPEAAPEPTAAPSAGADADADAGASAAATAGKLTGWDWYRSVGSPRFVLSPMVGQSELAYRMLCRRHGTQLCYTPMIIASKFVESESYRRAVWQTCPEDRPLVVQFCANDPATLVAAGKLVQSQCDAIDLNLGCPQEVARRGGYGSYLMEHQDKVRAMVSAASKALNIPVTVKIRVFPEFSKTLAYCRLLEAAGASLLTMHGRQRHHREEVLADWSTAHRIRPLLSIPVVLNGDLWAAEDVANCLAETDVDGFMSAQGILHNPALFEPLARRLHTLPRPAQQPPASAPRHPAALGGAQTFHWTAPVPDDRLRQRRHISPFFSFALTTVFNHPLTRVRGEGVSNGCGVNNAAHDGADAADAADAATGSSSAVGGTAAGDAASGVVMTRAQLKAAFAAPFSTPEDARRQFALAAEYLDCARQYPPYHASMVRRHLFFMLFDSFQANLDQYDLLCDATKETEYRDIIGTLHARAEAGVNKRLKDAYSAKDGGKQRARRRDGTVAPPPWPTGGGGMNVSKNGTSAGAAITGAVEPGNKQGQGQQKGGKGARGNHEEDRLTVIGNGMSVDSAKALARASATGLDPTRLRNVDLSKFD